MRMVTIWSPFAAERYPSETNFAMMPVYGLEMDSVMFGKRSLSDRDCELRPEVQRCGF